MEEGYYVNEEEQELERRKKERLLSYSMPSSRFAFYSLTAEKKQNARRGEKGWMMTTALFSLFP